MKSLMTPLTLATLLFAGVARADVHCEVPMTDWQPRKAVTQLAVENGWTLRRIKIDDGCYEIAGTDAEGRKFKLKLHPGTLAVVTPDQDDDDDRHHRKGPDNN